MTVEISAFSSCTPEKLSAETVISVFSAATDSLTFTVFCDPTVTDTFWSTVAKPPAAIDSWYEPGFNCETEYPPVLLVTLTRWAPVSLFVTVTLAAATTAPVESVTVPLIEPRSACALRA